jgi:hypothetical protein
MAELPTTAVEPRNTLDKAASSYLRSAMHQPVHWQEWGEAAFALAVQTDKPILLDVGAVWCHWCHVMDRESYEDPTLAHTINEHFVAIKVDRDERPDVDARYQAAVQAIAGQGGWPLTAMLTPDGLPFFAGTYFPREDRYGRPGFERVLLTLANAWKTRRNEVLESAASVIAAIEHGETFSARGEGLSLTIVDKLVQSAIGQFDPRNGGFGIPPCSICSLMWLPAPATKPLRKPRPSHSARWRVAESTISSQGASTATPSTSAGSFPISRRCSTTTPACSRTTSMPSRPSSSRSSPPSPRTSCAG